MPVDTPARRGEPGSRLDARGQDDEIGGSEPVIRGHDDQARSARANPRDIDT